MPPVRLMRILRMLRVLVVLYVVVLLQLSTKAVCLSQTPAPATTTVLKATLADLEKGPHTGPVETALVGLEIYGRHGNGFVLRCDGFLVVPYDLFDLMDNQVTPNLTVTFAPGTSHEQKLVMPRRSRNFINNQRLRGFTVFRTTGYVHTPALRTLCSDNVKPGPDGDTVEVVWSAWNAATKRFGALQRRRIGLAPLPLTETAEQKQGAEETARKRPGFVRFAQPLAASDGIPAGAVVLGPEGLAIGIVPGGGPGAIPDGFVSFSILDEVTNCVGAVPTLDSLFQVEHPAKRSDEQGEKPDGTDGTGDAMGGAVKPLMTKDEMISVPGGPVILPQRLLSDQPDMELEPIACLAPFQIDKYEVTNQQYKAFLDSTLQHLTDEERKDLRVKLRLRQALYPLGWAPEGAPFPPDIADLPVIGVPLAGAKAYAKWIGKRLPTPYEWAKAAFGPKGETQTPEWIQRYLLARQEAWRNAVEAHENYIKRHPEMLMPDYSLQGDPEQPPFDVRRPPKTVPPPDRRTFMRSLADFSIPWLFYDFIYEPRTRIALAYAERFSKETSFRLVDQLMSEWKDPIYMLAVGSRAYDVSPYGAHDMLLNADEMYLPNPQTPVFGSMRYVHLQWADRLPLFSGSDLFFDVFGLAFRPNYFSPYAEARLSRLYKRVVRQYRPDNGPEPFPIRELAGLSNMMDLRLMLFPLSGWYLYVGRDYEISMDPNSEILNQHGHDELPPNFKVLGWAGFSNFHTAWFSDGYRYQHRELGWPTALQGTVLIPPLRNNGRTLSEGYSHDLFYYLPVGFRCAR